MRELVCKVPGHFGVYIHYRVVAMESAVNGFD